MREKRRWRETLSGQSLFAHQLGNLALVDTPVSPTVGDRRLPGYLGTPEPGGQRPFDVAGQPLWHTSSRHSHQYFDDALAHHCAHRLLSPPHCCSGLGGQPTDLARCPGSSIHRARS